MIKGWRLDPALVRLRAEQQKEFRDHARYACYERECEEKREERMKGVVWETIPVGHASDYASYTKDVESRISGANTTRDLMAMRSHDSYKN